MTNLSRILLILVSLGIGYVFEPLLFKSMGTIPPAQAPSTDHAPKLDPVKKLPVQPTPQPEIEPKIEPKIATQPDPLPEETSAKVITPKELVKKAPPMPKTPQVIEEPQDDPELADLPEVPEPETSTKLDEAAIIAVMKLNVKNKGVTQFNASQVISWSAGTDLKYNGDTYQTGRVLFKVHTILGEQKQEALALIEKGHVYKWIWAKTKLEMR